MSEGRTLLRMGVLALMWGSSFFWIKLGLNAFSPVQLVLVRLLLGAAVLLVLCYSYRDRLPSGGRIWLHLGVAALFHNALPFLLFAIGELTVDSGTTGVLNATTPLWALVVALLWRTERGLNPARICGLVTGLAGTVLIFAPWQASDLLSWGSVAILAGAMSYGFVFVYEQRFLTASGASPVALAGSQMLAASGFLVLAMPFGGLGPIQLDPGAVLAVVVLGVFSTGIAFAVNYRLLAEEGAVAAATVGYLMPVVSILLGTLLLNEQLNLRVVAGMVVVLLGVALTRVRRNGAGARAEPEPAAGAPQGSGTLP
ncbi:DMT family transporter [Amycolatopsis aidingensis]|uniref:DMT family transporter n=1 Tax=Amycolatopsis aidingensis TaxID=2842453 RepID=UPI001C0D15D3|nr:DMT family transporter [Amycolatopsis aidingensis]